MERIEAICRALCRAQGERPDEVAFEARDFVILRWEMKVGAVIRALAEPSTEGGVVVAAIERELAGGRAWAKPAST